MFNHILRYSVLNEQNCFMIFSQNRLSSIFRYEFGNERFPALDIFRLKRVSTLVRCSNGCPLKLAMEDDTIKYGQGIHVTGVPPISFIENSGLPIKTPNSTQIDRVSSSNSEMICTSNKQDNANHKEICKANKNTRLGIDQDNVDTKGTAAIVTRNGESSFDWKRVSESTESANLTNSVLEKDKEDAMRHDVTTPNLSHKTHSSMTKKSILDEKLLDKITSYVVKHRDDMDLIKTPSDSQSSIGRSYSVPDFMLDMSNACEDGLLNITTKNKRKRQYSPEEGGAKKTSKKKKTSKESTGIRPNYFLAIQVTNQSIHKGLDVVQQHILRKEELLKPAAIALPTIHLTLAVLSLQNEEDIHRTKVALDACKARLEPLITEPLALTIAGMGTFRNDVVFASLKTGPALKKLEKITDIVYTVLSEHGLHPCDKKGFKPHITIFKLSKLKKKQKKKGIKKIPPELYRQYRYCTFGSQTVRSIQLCAMLKAKSETGYYHVAHTCDIGPEDEEDPQIEICELDHDCEKHICAPQASPSKEFQVEFEKEIKWIFRKPQSLDP